MTVHLIQMQTVGVVSDGSEGNILTSGYNVMIARRPAAAKSKNRSWRRLLMALKFNWLP